MPFDFLDEIEAKLSGKTQEPKAVAPSPYDLSDIEAKLSQPKAVDVQDKGQDDLSDIEDKLSIQPVQTPERTTLMKSQGLDRYDPTAPSPLYRESEEETKRTQTALAQAAAIEDPNNRQTAFRRLAQTLPAGSWGQEYAARNLGKIGTAIENDQFTQPTSAAQVYGQELAQSAIPAVAGIATGAKSGAALGAIGANPVTVIGGAIIGGLAGAFLAGKGQEKIQKLALGEQTYKALESQRAAGREEHPVAATAAELTPIGASFRPSPDLMVKSAQMLRDIGKVGLKKAILENPEGFQAIVNSSFGAGTQAAQEAVNSAATGDFTPVKSAVTIALAALGQKPTALGKALTGQGAIPKEAMLTPDEVKAVAPHVNKELAKVIEAAPEPKSDTAATVEPVETKSFFDAKKQADDLGIDTKGLTTKAEVDEVLNAYKGFEAVASRELVPEATPSVSRESESDLYVVPESGDMAETRLTARTSRSKKTPEEVKQGLKETAELEHQTQRIADLDAWAKTQVEAGEEAAKTRVFSGERSSEVIALGAKLRDAYRKSGRVSEEVEITDHIGKIAKESGRAANAVKLWYRGLSPEGYAESVRSIAKKNGIKVEDAQIAELLELKKAMDAMPEGSAKDDARQTLMDKTVDVVPPTFWDKLSAYRYNNALSSPRSTFRNIFQNVFNMSVVKPLSMAMQGDLKGAWRWNRDAAVNIKEAAREFAKAMSDVDTGPFEEGIGKGEIEAARRKRIPYALRMFPQFMNAQDKFFSTMIRRAVESSEIRKGSKPEVAKQRGETTANRYLLRDAIGKDLVQIPYATRVLDEVGKILESAVSGKILGKAASPFVMFIKTPINAAKRMVEFSPLGFARPYKLPKNLPKERVDELRYMQRDEIARATLGTLAMGMGGVLAATGNTAWMPPRNEEARAQWYKTGRKPFSVKIGETWVPMWYFGPAALALAAPAAMAYYYKEQDKAIPMDVQKKAAGTAAATMRFLMSQTSTKGMSQFIDVLTGEGQNIPSSFGFVSSQLIPYSAAIRYANSIFDPTMRKSKTYVESLKRDIPMLSKELEGYETPDGTWAKRTWSDWVLPYTIGKNDKQASEQLLEMQKEIGYSTLERQEKKEEGKTMQKKASRPARPSRRP